MDKDLFVQRMRQEAELKSSFLAYLDDYRTGLLNELPAIDNPDLMRICVGAIRGIDRLKKRLVKEVTPSVVE